MLARELEGLLAFSGDNLATGVWKTCSLTIHQIPNLGIYRISDRVLARWVGDAEAKPVDDAVIVECPQPHQRLRFFKHLRLVPHHLEQHLLCPLGGRLI